MPLETGTWMIIANGQSGQLIISSVVSSGNLSGTMYVPGVTPGEPSTIQGFWDETSQKITFGLTDVLNVFQVYTGFLFQDRFRITGVTGSVVFTLAGCFQTFTVQGSIGSLVGSVAVTARRHTFGWYAQIGVD
jgi:hypothetical protein